MRPDLVGRAQATFDLIFAYGEVGNLAEARALFEAMKAFGDSEEVKLERAKASVNLIYYYGNAGNLAEARALFEAMKAFGESKEVKRLRVLAAKILDSFL